MLDKQSRFFYLEKEDLFENKAFDLINITEIQNLRKRKKNLDFNEIDERLAAGWYVNSGQRKRYLKSIIKDKKE